MQNYGEDDDEVYNEYIDTTATSYAYAHIFIKL